MVKENQTKEETEKGGEKMTTCPMCQLTEKFQRPDPDSENKTQCTGCGIKFFDRER